MIIRSGTYIARQRLGNGTFPGTLVVAGSWTHNLEPGSPTQGWYFLNGLGDGMGGMVARSGTATATGGLDPNLLLTPDSYPVDIGAEDLPVGFRVRDKFRFQLPGSRFSGGSLAGVNEIRYQFAALGIDIFSANTDGVLTNNFGSNYDAPEGITGDGIPFTGMTLLQLVGLGGMQCLVTATATATRDDTLPIEDGTIALHTDGWNANGAYDIVAFWWTIPSVDACGEAHTPELQLASADPGQPWVRLDPVDEDAHPTPAITLLVPAHGPAAGGTACEIRGSGFGHGATVAVDGVPATSVVVVSAVKITCVVPTHTPGTADVVVTNVDGVSS